MKKSEVALSRIFLVSADSNHSQNLASIFSNQFEFSSFTEETTCLQYLHQRPKVIFFEIENKAQTALAFSDRIFEFDPNIAIVLILKNNNTASKDFFEKSNICDCLLPEELTEHRIYFLLCNLMSVHHAREKLENLEAKIHHDYLKNIVCSSDEMQRVVSLVNKAANNNITCCLSGEKGTGKATIAYGIHYLSDRKSAPYVYVNLNSIETENLEKELFGVENDFLLFGQKGKLELADNGTLYLEDVHLLPLSTQKKLLETLQDGFFYRAGGTTKVAWNIRLIVSTRKDLLIAMQAGNFMESLYYRLMGLPIHIPALRNRGNDILLLSKIFLEKFCAKNNFDKKEFSKKAKQKLLSYSFPGNISELKSTVERAIVLSEKTIIDGEDIEFVRTPQHLSFLDQDLTFEAYKSKIIHHYLKRYDNDILLVSSKLDIGKSTIYRMLKSEKEKPKRRMNWFNLF